MFLCSTAGGERWREPPFSGVSLDDVDVCYVLRIEVGPVLGFLVGYMMGRRMALLPLKIKNFLLVPLGSPGPCRPAARSTDLVKSQ